MKSKYCVLAVALTAASAAWAASPASASDLSAGSSHRIMRATAHGNGMALAPHGTGDILYDQTSAYDGTGAPVTTYSDVSISQFDADGADDFTVGAGGWTVSAFNFLAFNSFFDSGVQRITNMADVRVYLDAGGRPAATPVCTSMGSSNTPSAYDPATTLTAITLNTPCALDAGTYWVSLSYEYDGENSEYVPVFWGLSASTNGGTAMWRQPSGTSCTDWSPVTDCFTDPATSDHDYAFQVIGVAGIAGGGGGNLDLALTAAIDNGDPAQCGTSSSFSVDQGQTINLCYTLTNHTGHALNYQTLSDTRDGNLFSLTQQPIPDGGTFHFNRQIVAQSSIGGTITANWSAQDRQPNYTYDNTGASRFVDITGTGTPLGLADDGIADVPMPFSFAFYGTTTNVLSISNNGGISIGTPGSILGFLNFALPTLFNNSTPVILPMWDDFGSTSGNVYYETIGNPGSRQFVVEWADRVHLPVNLNTDGATFEIVFNEADNTFSFEYSDVEFSCNNSAGSADCSGGQSATIGIQHDDVFEDPVRSTYTEYSLDTNAVADGESVLWTPVPVAAFVATSTLTLDVGAAVVSAAPGNLSATAAAGAQASATLNIGNAGNRDLTWSIDEAPSTADARSHFPLVAHHATADAPSAGHASSSLPAPRVDGKAFSVPARRSSPFGADAVPAFGVLPQQETLYSLDANDAAELSPVGALNSLANLYDGGTFANNDFSKIYLVGPEPFAGEFVAVDTVTGAVSVIDTDPTVQTGGFNVTVLAWDASTGTMWASADENQPINPPPGFQPISHIYTVDPASGTFKHAFDLSNTLVVAIAFDAAGRMYALDILSDTLLAVDKTSGDFEEIGPIGFDANNAQAMDFDPRTGILWYAGCEKAGLVCTGQMYTLDTATGLATPVQNGAINGDGEEMTALSIAVPKGPCANPADVPWLSVTPSTGTTPAGATTAVDVQFDAAALQPGTYDANLCLRGSDLSHPIVVVPVQFTVSGGDNIFADGFDGAAPL